MSCVCRAPFHVVTKEARLLAPAAGEERAHPPARRDTRACGRVDACLATSVYSDEEPCRCAI